VLPAYRRAFLIQKSAGGGLSYKVKKCLLVTGHHVVRHSITQNVIKALSVEGIHCDVCLRLQQYVVE
jgi:alcohol dehydrogenase class IV